MDTDAANRVGRDGQSGGHARDARQQSGQKERPDANQEPHRDAVEELPARLDDADLHTAGNSGKVAGKLPWWHGEQQASRRLGIEYQVPTVVRNLPTKFNSRPEVVLVGLHSSRPILRGDFEHVHDESTAGSSNADEAIMAARR